MTTGHFFSFFLISSSFPHLDFVSLTPPTFFEAQRNSKSLEGYRPPLTNKEARRVSQMKHWDYDNKQDDDIVPKISMND